MSNGELVIGFNFKYFSYLCLYSLTFVLSASLISGRLFPPRPRPLPVPRPPLLAGKIPKKERKKFVKIQWNIFLPQHRLTLRFFFKFVSWANNSKSYSPSKWPRKQKNQPLKSFWNKPASNPATFDQVRPKKPGHEIYIGPKNDIPTFLKYLQNMFPGLTKRLLNIFIHFWLL